MIASNVSGVSAKILADSVCNGKRLTSFEITLPKVLLAELNTHRILSKNFSSSRAIPVGKFAEIDSFAPKNWLKNQSGMIAKQEVIADEDSADFVWGTVINDCKEAATKLSKLDVHKQWANRPNDWHIVAKGVLSGTDWANFLWLRNHSAAQPEIRELAEIIDKLLQTNVPVSLLSGQWHLPYVRNEIVNGKQTCFDVSGNAIELEVARKISASCCAQASYRKLDESVEKSLDLYDKLLGMDRLHCSPFEHVATPISEQFPFSPWTEGITHRSRDNDYWSGNFRGWIQYRHLIPGNTVW